MLLPGRARVTTLPLGRSSPKWGNVISSPRSMHLGQISAAFLSDSHARLETGLEKSLLVALYLEGGLSIWQRDALHVAIQHDRVR